MDKLLEQTKKLFKECDTSFELTWNGKEWVASFVRCNDECCEQSTCKFKDILLIT